MSGFETSRFVGLSESMAKHMSCSICLGIYCKPVETQCGHTFCQQCIKQWINQNNNSCPQCRQQLANKRKRNSRNNNNSIDESVMFWETNRNFVNLINDLKIKCDFVLKGCNEVLELGLLSDHLEKCDYNYCKTCGLKMGKKDEHNCIELLKRDRNKFKQLFIETQRFVEKYKHDLNDNKNQLMTKSLIFEEKIQKYTERIDELVNEKLDFEKERQQLMEKISSLEKMIANNNNEKTANVLNYSSVDSSSAPVLVNDCDKRTESNEVVNEYKESESFETIN